MMQPQYDEIEREYHYNCRLNRSFSMTVGEYRTAVKDCVDQMSGLLDTKGACIMVFNRQMGFVND